MKKRYGLFCIFLMLLPSVFADVFLHDYIYEGETKIIPVNSGYYEIRLVIVSDVSELVLFSVNGELTRALHEREKDYLLDGSRIFIGDILVDESGRDLVEFYFIGTGRAVLHETVAEIISVPYEKVEPGLIEEQPTIKPLCDGCLMNEKCYPYQYRYDPDEETSLVCSADGSWKELIEEQAPADVEIGWNRLINWINSLFI